MPQAEPFIYSKEDAWGGSHGNTHAKFQRSTCYRRSEYSFSSKQSSSSWRSKCFNTCSEAVASVCKQADLCQHTRLWVALPYSCFQRLVQQLTSCRSGPTPSRLREEIFASAENKRIHRMCSHAVAAPAF